MVARVRVAHIAQSRDVRAIGVHRIGRHRRDVRVLTRRHRAGRLVVPRLGQIQSAVAVDIAADKRQREVIARRAGSAVVVAQHDRSQRHIARVGYHVGECGRGTNQQQRTRRRIGVLAIGVLHDLNARACAKVIAGIRIGYLCIRGIHCIHAADVRVLTRRHDSRGGVDPGFGKVQDGITVGIPADECRSKVIGRVPRRAVIVGNLHIVQRCSARIAHVVSECRRRPDGQDRTGRRIGIESVGQFHDLDRGHLIFKIYGEFIRPAALEHGHRCIQIRYSVDQHLNGSDGTERGSGAASHDE